MKYQTQITMCICVVSFAMTSCTEVVDLSKYSDQRSSGGEIICVIKLSSDFDVVNMYDDKELEKIAKTSSKFHADINNLNDNLFFEANDGHYGLIPSFYPCNISLLYAESVAGKYYHENEMTFGISSVEAYKKALARLKPIDAEMQKYLDESGFGKPEL